MFFSLFLYFQVMMHLPSDPTCRNPMGIGALQGGKNHELQTVQGQEGCGKCIWYPGQPVPGAHEYYAAHALHYQNHHYYLSPFTQPDEDKIPQNAEPVAGS